MSRTRISQREARRMKKRIAELENVFAQQRNAWVSEWPRGVHISSLTCPTDATAAIRITRKLGHAVVCTTGRSADVVDFYALPLAK